MRRTLCLLSCSLLLLWLGACSQPKTPTPEPDPPSPPPPPPLPSLIVYYQHQKIPSSWVRTWTTDRPIKIEQRAIEKLPLPLDGDVYLLEPRWFQLLRAQTDLVEFEDAESINSINRAFLHHPFDPDSTHSLPIHWTPYFLHVKKKEGKTPKTAKFADLLKDKAWNWPENIDLLTALTTKAAGKSANLPESKDRDRQKKSLTEDLEDRTKSDTRLWSGLTEGDLPGTLLPASFLNLHPKQAKNISWKLPARGTLIRLQLASSRKETKHLDHARELIEFLLAKEQQDQLQDLTGNFSVLGSRGDELKGSNVPLPKGSWFGYSEILLEPPLPLPEPPPKEEPAETPKSEEESNARDETSPTP